jgi:hypothetical protein
MGRKKLTIQHAHDLAESKGWECLSTEYINALSHLKWRCSECKHEWMAIFNNIKSNNSGCPHCYENTMGSIEKCKAFAI